jgi:hypothetical protein
MSEPGFDLHEWESEWASIEDGTADDPHAALSQYAEIVERMLLARGYRVNDPVEAGGDEREIVETYRSAREVAERAELGEASRGEVEAAIADLREVFETLTATRP